MPDEFVKPDNAQGLVANGRLPEIVVYEHPDFKGRELRTNLSAIALGQDGPWNDTISSIVVVSGVWEFYSDSYYNGNMTRLGPGFYANEGEMRISNDAISSWKVVGN